MKQIIEFLASLAPWGSIVNCVAVIFGSLLGLAFKHLMDRGSENGAAKRISGALMSGMGLCVLAIGAQGAIAMNNVLVVIISMAIGTLIGEAIDLDKYIGKLGDALQSRTKGKFGRVTEGFVGGTLLFCVGSMTIVGSLNSGLLGDHTMLYAKSLIDMVASVVLASTLGIGVLFSSLFVLVFQGGISLLATYVEPFLNSTAILEMSAIGSILLIAISLNMLGLTKFKTMNFMPAIFIPIIIYAII